MQTLRRPTTILSWTAFIVLLATLFGATNMGNRIFYKGPNKGAAVCNFAGNILYEGVNKAKSILNIDGDKAWEGVNKAKCLFNISGNNVYEGVNKGKVLFNIENEVFKWSGLSPSTEVGHIFQCVLLQTNPCLVLISALLLHTH